MLSDHEMVCVFERNPSDELLVLARAEPANDAPVHDQVVWHERMAELWDRVAVWHPVMDGNAAYVVEVHRRRVKELREQQRPREGRPVR